MDIFKDTCAPEHLADSLEVQKIKNQVRSLWEALLRATYEKEYKYQVETDDKFMTLEHYMDDNALIFNNEEQPEDEADNLLLMFEDMIMPKEELESVGSGSKAPTYGSTSLQANKDTSKVAANKYNPEFASTKTPSDSETKATSSTYDKPKDGKTLTSKTHERSFSSIQEIEDYLELERQRLLKHVAQRNKKFGVQL